MLGKLSVSPNVYIIKYKHEGLIREKNIVARCCCEALEIFNVYIDDKEIIDIKLK